MPRRRYVHFNVTANPTVEWSTQQIFEAFPLVSTARFLLRDRDSIYQDLFRRRVQSTEIEEVLTVYRSSWQNPYVERLNESIGRKCTDHIIVFSEIHLRRILGAHFAYCHEDRTHLEFDKEIPMEGPMLNRASPSSKLVSCFAWAGSMTPTNGAKPHEYLRFINCEAQD